MIADSPVRKAKGKETPTAKPGALLRAVMLLAEYGREVLEEQERVEKERVQTECAH